MDDWSHDLSPEPARAPPPKMTDLKDYDFWDADHLSLASLPDPAADLWPAHGDDHTFSSEPSLGARVESTLQCSVPKNVLSHHLRQHAPLATLHPNRPSTMRPRTAKADPTLVPRELRARHRLEELKTQLTEANAQVADLTEKQRVEDEELAKLHRTVEILSTSNARLTEEKGALHSKIEEESNRYKSLEATIKSFQDESTSSKLELQRCQAAFDATRAKLTETQRDLAHSNAQCQHLETQLTERPSIDTRAIREMRKSNQELNSCNHALEEENRELRQQAEEQMTALNAKCEEYAALTEECAILRRQLDKGPSRNVFAQTDSVETSCVEVQTEAASGGFDPTMISERLSGAREVLERTSLLRRHQEEVARLVHDHEQNVSDMEKRHSRRLQEVEDQAAEEVATKVLQTRRSLTSDHQKRLDEMQRRHRTVLVKVREERDRKIATLTDSLEEALAQVTATTEQLDHEYQARRVLEGRLEALSVDCEREKNILLEHHHNELQTMRANAEDERATLLDEIQRGCNEVITDKRRYSEAPISTRTTASQFDFGVGPIREEPFPPNELTPVSLTAAVSAGQALTGGDRTETLKPRNPPLTSQRGYSLSLSQSLAETEAIVLELLGGSRF
jgi:hypothetical protein